jgi:hypothetical protein
VITTKVLMVLHLLRGEQDAVTVLVVVLQEVLRIGSQKE